MVYHLKMRNLLASRVLTLLLLTMTVAACGHVYVGDYRDAYRTQVTCSEEPRHGNPFSKSPDKGMCEIRLVPKASWYGPDRPSRD